MGQLKNKKVVLSVVVIVVAVLAASTLLDRTLDAMPGSRAISQKCNAYVENWTAKSIATFAIAKSINAGLSVIEESQVQLAMVDVAAGEVVRPLNEMVEKVSTVALASAVSLGIQQMLMKIGAWVAFPWLLTASMICWLVVIWIDSSAVRRLAWGLLLVALIARFLIPATVLATGYIGDRFLEDAYANAQRELEQLDAEAKKAKSLDAAGAPTEKTGPFGLVTETVAAVSEVPKRVSDLISRLGDQADTYNRVAVTYIVVFIVQTMLMPILILWGLIKLLCYLFTPAALAAPRTSADRTPAAGEAAKGRSGLGTMEA